LFNHFPDKNRRGKIEKNMRALPKRFWREKFFDN